MNIKVKRMVMVLLKIKFLVDGQELHFKRFDSYEIPVNALHEVIGVHDENLFTVTHEL